MLVNSGAPVTGVPVVSAPISELLGATTNLSGAHQNSGDGAPVVGADWNSGPPRLVFDFAEVIDRARSVLARSSDFEGYSHVW